MSASGSVSGVASQVPLPPHAATLDENLEAPSPWTLAQNGTMKITLHTQWVDAFRANLEKISQAVATSIYNQFCRRLDSTTKSGFTAYATSDAPFRATYPLSLRTNGAQLKKWAGETADLAPFKEWFAHYIPPAEKSQGAVQKGDLDPLLDHKFIESMVNILGKRIEMLVKEQFEVFKQNGANKNLITEVKWNPKVGSTFLSSLPSFAPPCPSLHISTWLDAEYVAELQIADKALLEKLEISVNDSKSLQSPAAIQKNQALPSSLWNGVCFFFSGIGRIFTMLLYPIRWLFGKISPSS